MRGKKKKKELRFMIKLIWILWHGQVISLEVLTVVSPPLTFLEMHTWDRPWFKLISANGSLAAWPQWPQTTQNPFGQTGHKGKLGEKFTCLAFDSFLLDQSYMTESCKSASPKTCSPCVRTHGCISFSQATRSTLETENKISNQYCRFKIFWTTAVKFLSSADYKS